ncbi:hypothetical protein TKK_0018572 [Trichogramma kaykai]|uniref:Uncharacterized protein n=1 Tax=Trichogramma kaykai TaxID=54128 RepID=A0ABD2VYJ1_9HYME
MDIGTGYHYKNDGEQELIPLEVLFFAYCRMDPVNRRKKGSIQQLPLSQSDQWLKDAEILDMKRLTTTDTGTCFFKFRKRALDWDEYQRYLQDLAKLRNLNLNEMRHKMQCCPLPQPPDANVNEEASNE